MEDLNSRAKRGADTTLAKQRKQAGTAVLRTYDGTSLRCVKTAASPMTAGLRPYDYASVTSGISGDSGVS